MLTFQEFQRATVARAAAWHGPDTEPWLGVDWSNAMGGECGEAQNVVKKIRRVETGVFGHNDLALHDLVTKLGEEIADTITYAFHLAHHYGIDVGEAVAQKFNAVSEREGFPHRVAP